MPAFSTTTAKLALRIKQELADFDLTLPPLPDTAQKVSDAINDPDVDSIKVAKIIRADPVLSGRVIQAANSPLFRGLERTDGLQNAVARLGLTCVRNLVISLTMNTLFSSQANNTAIKQRLKDVWAMSTKVAAVSEALAHNRWRIDPSEAMLAGLLHNIGVLPMLAKYVEFGVSVEQITELDALLSADQAKVSKWILEQWNLRSELTSVPIETLDLNRQTGRPADYVDIVQVAQLHCYRGKQHPLGKIKWIGIPAFDRMDMTPESSMQAIKEAQGHIQETLSLLRG